MKKSAMFGAMTLLTLSLATLAWLANLLARRKRDLKAGCGNFVV